MAERFRKGERVEWSFRGHRVVGVVVRRLVEPTTVGGRPVRASREDPRYLVRVDRSGKEAAHRGQALRRVRND